MNFKPMLSADASTYDLKKLRWPLLISPKLDGLRCIVWEGVAYSRNAKPFRNRSVQEWASDKHNLDGEIIVGSPTDPNCLDNSKAVTAFNGEPDFKLYLFDAPEGYSDKFDERLAHVQGEHMETERIHLVPHFRCQTVDEFLEHEAHFVSVGYEGVMLRLPSGPYKFGRSTMNEQYLMKYKRFIDGEAVVVDLEEGHTNTNTQERDELGRAKRSFVKSGLVGNGMVGTLICEDPKWGRIRVAPGKMTHHERRWFWVNRDGKAGEECIVGQTIHWRSFGHGTKEAPRFARYYGIREDNE